MTALTFFFIMIALQFKHFFVDFIFQDEEMIKSKGIYGSWQGLVHSLYHGGGTLIILILFGIPFGLTAVQAIVLSFIDNVVHYHVDWLKMKYGNKNPQTQAFWIQFGLDQLLHQLTYIAILALTYLSIVGL